MYLKMVHVIFIFASEFKNDMEQMLKYVWVLKTLQKAGERGITLAEINEKWRNHVDLSRGEELPRQTFNRWKNELEEFFGVSIECKRKGGYRYYIADPEALEGNGLSSWLLNTFATAGTLTGRMRLKDRILVEEVPSSQDYLEDIIDAMQNGNVLRMTYRGFNKKESNTFDVEPYCVKMFQRCWYLLARSPYYDEVRLYGLDRIENLHITQETFKLPEDFNAEEYFSTFFGIVLHKDVDVQRIIIRANEYHKNYLRTLPLHHSQKELCDEGDYADFELTLRPTYDFYMELLRVGSMIEVIEPQAVRKTMHEWVSEMWNLYKNEK